ncbi:2614_t:CDS:2 [Diversispora eburnea]|uniref:2614_t:CDS:1 n=1 Tax=Diversispora eburnea TaxID=1213867 RepID=A0A9N9G6P1_9GLOM|nr:2614_t:CDS:2 [Diversispora eburnea]
MEKSISKTEKILRKLQTIGILNSANRLQLLTMDIPMELIQESKSKINDLDDSDEEGNTKTPKRKMF